MRVVIRGAGDLASGIALRLWRAGLDVVLLDVAKPTAIRRTVAFSEAIVHGEQTVEDVTARLAALETVPELLRQGILPVLIDPEGASIPALHPDALVDAILAKRNLGTKITDAPVVIGVGPGFTAGVDVDVVIETSRGHNLGRVIKSGTALPNTGRPGNIGGYTVERVIHSPAAGVIHNVRAIGDTVAAGERIAWVESADGCVEVNAAIPGILRGLIREGYYVTSGFKIADIDPRLGELANCFTISDKARCIAGSVLEQVCAALNGKEG